MNENKSYDKIAWLLLIVLSIIWGSSFILIKKGLEVYPADQVGTLRIIFAFIVLLPLVVKRFKGISKKDWFYLFMVGAIGNLIPSLLFSIAETELSSSITGILNALTPIFTLIIALFIFKTGIKLWQFVGLLIGFIGSVGISFVNAEGNLGSLNFYVLYVVAATICYGLSINIIKVQLSHLKSVVQTALAIFTVGPFSLIYLLTTDFTTRLTTHPDALASLGFIFILGFCGTAVALVLFNRLIFLTTAVFASSVTYLIPIVAVFWGILIGENLYPLHFAGMALIIFGVYKVNKPN